MLLKYFLTQYRKSNKSLMLHKKRSTTTNYRAQRQFLFKARLDQWVILNTNTRKLEKY